MDSEPPMESRRVWLVLGGGIVLLLITALAYYMALWWITGLLWGHIAVWLGWA